jgi:hypothetical protein
MQYPSYWISPYGDIMPLTAERHITEIWENPEKFGLTLKEIEAIFKKHKERRGSEGNAREEIMGDLIRNQGWGRVRYISSGDAFTIQIGSLTNTQKENIYDWAKIASKDVGPYTGVVIMEIKPGGDILRGTLKDITSYKMFEEMKRNRPRKSKVVTFIENYIARNK